MRISFRMTFAIALVLVLTATGLWAGGATDTESATAADKEMVRDPATGKMVTAPEYGGTFTRPLKEEWHHPDLMFSRWATVFITGVLEKPAMVNWGIDRAEFNYVGEAPLFALKGGLAESWEQPDPLTIIFKVRQGVHWHNKPPMNGRELTAQDIEYNYHRLLGLGSGFTEVSEVIPGGLTDVVFESITATDNWTVVFTLKEPHLDALRIILDDHYVHIYPPEVIKEHGDATDWRNLVGTGPFMLTERVEGSSITWTKNPDYWGYDEKYPQNRLPYVDEIRCPIMPEEATYLAALRSGCCVARPGPGVGCRIEDAECGGGRSVPSACLERNGGTAERWAGRKRVGNRGSGSCGQVPAVGAADGEAALLESLESDTETSVVDAQALAQDGPGEWLAGAAESGADRLGERWRRGVSAVDEQREGLVATA